MQPSFLGNLLLSSCQGPFAAMTGGDAGPPVTPPGDPETPPKSFYGVTIPGSVEALVGGKQGNKQGCFGVTIHDAKPKFFFAPDNGQTIELKEIVPLRPLNFSANGGIQMETGQVAIPYQSTDGFGGQDGLAHGVMIFTEGGDRLLDHDLNSYGYTRPVAVLNFTTKDYRTGNEENRLFVLVNNGDIRPDANFTIHFRRPSSILSFVDPFSSQALGQDISEDYRNAGAMALLDGFLMVALADNTSIQTNAEAGVVALRPWDLQLQFQFRSSIYPGVVEGVGINGVAPVSEKGKILFTGIDRDHGKSPMMLYDKHGVEAIDLTQTSTIFRGAYIAGAQFYFEQILFNVNQTGRPQVYLYNPETKTLKLLAEEESGYPLPFVGYAPHQYCEGMPSNGMTRIKFWKP